MSYPAAAAAGRRGFERGADRLSSFDAVARERATARLRWRAAAGAPLHNAAAIALAALALPWQPAR